ncbi:MAG TPA: hypothetical protein VMB84_09520 [Stellaceae bacterium]|nr:hypothetical protein [Stellaceae bacterium]
MSNATERALRRHLREKAEIKQAAKGVGRHPAPPAGDPAHGATTSDGLPVEQQVRKQWNPNKKGGLPTFWRDPPAFLLSPRSAAARSRG